MFTMPILAHAVQVCIAVSGLLLQCERTWTRQPSRSTARLCPRRDASAIAAVHRSLGSGSATRSPAGVVSHAARSAAIAAASDAAAPQCSSRPNGSTREIPHFQRLSCEPASIWRIDLTERFRRSTHPYVSVSGRPTMTTRPWHGLIQRLCSSVRGSCISAFIIAGLAHDRRYLFPITATEMAAIVATAMALCGATIWLWGALAKR